MALIAKVRADLSNVGPIAVVRVLYELSKRFGGHDLVFRGLRSTSISRARRGEEAVTLEAIHLARRNFCATNPDSGAYPPEPRIFAKLIDFRTASDWHSTLESDQRWPKQYWWKIDIRSSDRIADVKWTWELSRHSYLVGLARSAASGDFVALRMLEERLSTWLDENPPELGVHWYSNLEIALRAVAWAQILVLVGHQLDAELRDKVAATLRHGGRHMLAELPYTVSSMRNNHLLGDALGMLVIGGMFAMTREGRALRRVGNRIFNGQLRRQVLADGSMIEDSISYHRFVLEMLAVRLLLSSPEEKIRAALERAAQFMFRLGVAEGKVPQYGDWDEGRVLAIAENRCDLLGSARVALALAGTGAPAEWCDAHEEVAWYAPLGEPVTAARAERDGHDVGGGIARAQRGLFTAWLKAGSQRSHGHADLCSTPVLFDCEWLVGDPGTGTYNGPIEQRNYFRCSIAHNVLRVGGLDQLEPHRAFRWQHAARGVIGSPFQVGDSTLMWGAHDAYRRLDPARRAARAVFVSEQLVVVADWVDGPKTSYAMSFPLHPSVEWCDDDLVLATGRRVRLELPSEPSRRAGQAAPYDGWWSRTYGHAEPATRLEITGTTECPVVWALRAQSTVDVAAEGNRLLIGVDTFEVQWRPAGAIMTHTRPDGRQVTATVSLA